MTTYNVLARVGDTNELEELTEVEANAADSAIRAVAKTLSPEVLTAGVRLIAVPRSNWREEMVQQVTPPPRIVVGGEQITVEEALEADPAGAADDTQGADDERIAAASDGEES